MTAIAPAIFAATVAAACAGSDSRSATRRMSAPPIRFDSIRITSGEGDCAAPIGACARVELLYPLAESETHPRAADAIHRTVADWLLGRAGDDARSASPDTVVAQFISAFLEFRRSNPTLNPRWRLIRTVRIVLDTLGVVTLRGDQDDYDGGAHGMASTFWASFSLATGRRLGVAELVARHDSARFRALVEGEFRKMRGFGPTAPFADSGFFVVTNGRFIMPPNIGVTGEGLVLQYNPYDVAGYAAGPTTVTLEWSALTGLVRPDGPAGPFVRRGAGVP